MSRQSKSTKKPNIYFFTLKQKKSTDHCSEDMMCAYCKCIEYGTQPIWISKRDFNKMKFMKFDTIVLEKYEQILFKQLTTANCYITNPKYLLSSYDVTQDRSPAYTRVMQDLCICASHLCFEDKTYVQALVKMMNGNFTTDLDDKVTHLITSSVLSVEYELAIHMKIQIVTKEWIKAIWEANKADYVVPNDKRFDKYKVSVFYNLVVTTTNIQKYEKEEIAHLIKNNGGVYVNALDVKKVDIVLAPKNSQICPELKYARELDIMCLTSNWVYESIKVGYALPFRNYIFQTVKERYSSRRSNVRETHSCFTTSDETAFRTSTMSNASTVPTVSTILDRPMFNEAEAAGPFLYGCIIYLAGFTSDQKDKLNRILNVGSARQFDYVCDILTHIIVGDEDSTANELQLLKSRGLCPYILTLEWLEESIRLKRPAPVKNFLYEQENSTLQEVIEPSSSLIMNSQLLQDRMSDKGEKSSNLRSQQEIQNAVVSTTDETVEEYLEQHIPALTQTPESVEEYLILPGTDNSDIIKNRLFEGLTFVVSGFYDKYNDVVENIVAMNGRVVPGTFVKIPDYGIVPICGMTLNCTVKEIVTHLFIEDCIKQDRIVEIMYYHRPMSVTKNVLLGCVLTISTYIGVERSYLVTLAIELGAMYQHVFAHKMTIEKDMYKYTRLVCPIPKGKKFNTAVRWKIPVVTAEWLIVCAAQSTWVDETPFLVVKSLVPSKGPERPMESDISLLQTNTNQIVLSTEPVASTSRSYNIIVPEKYFSNLETQNNTSDNMVLPNNELSLPMNTTSEPSETLCSQAFGPIPSQETGRSQLERINYSLNLI